MVKKSTGLIIGFFLLLAAGNSQTFLSKAEMEIKSSFDLLSETGNDDDKYAINERIISRMQNILMIKESFRYPFDSLFYVRKITSPDHNFRIYTWNLSLTNGTHKYFGFVQQSLQSDDSLSLHFLDDQAELFSLPDQPIYTNDKWYGAIYYQIIPVKIGKKRYYTLLGVDLNNLFTTRKLIDIFYMENNKVKFGFPVFSDGQNQVTRVVFEYSAQVSMTLNYSRSRKIIYFDHLAPSDPKFQGQYNHYGPDSSIDGFKFIDDKWIYMPDLDINQIN